MMQLLRNFICNDFWLKLFSLALAVLIWLVAGSFVKNRENPLKLQVTSETRRTYLDLPVLVMSSAADARNFRVAPSKVDVTVEGELEIIKSLPEKEIQVLVDVTDIEAAHSLKERIKVTTPPGVKLVSVNPREVQVIFPPAN
jgi:hypothetical protein